MTDPTGLVLPNFGLVDTWANGARLYRSGQPTEGAAQVLRTLSVDVVVKLNEEDEFPQEKERLLLGQDVTLVTMPVDAFRPTVDVGKALVHVITDFMTRGCSVLVHCDRGADRTGLAVGSYRLLRNRYEFSEVVEELDGYGFNRQLHVLPGSILEVLFWIAHHRHE